MAGKRGGRRHSTSSFSENVVVAGTSCQILVKSNKWSVINAAFLLVELLPGYMLYPSSSEKRRLFGGRKGLKSS